MKFYILMIAFLFAKIDLFSQASMIDNFPGTNIKPDSLYQIFVPPIVSERTLNKHMKDQSYYEFTIFVAMQVDTNGRVRQLKKFPIYGWGNDFASSSIIWKELLKSLDSVSKLWVLKPVNYLILDKYSPDLKEYYGKINRGETKMNIRPFGGRQFHCFLLNFYCYRKNSPSVDPSEPMFLYWMNVNISK